MNNKFKDKNSIILILVFLAVSVVIFAGLMLFISKQEFKPKTIELKLSREEIKRNKQLLRKMSGKKHNPVIPKELKERMGGAKENIEIPEELIKRMGGSK